jgi:hypothetical protein
MTRRVSIMYIVLHFQICLYVDVCVSSKNYCNPLVDEGQWDGELKEDGVGGA